MAKKIVKTKTKAKVSKKIVVTGDVHIDWIEVSDSPAAFRYKESEKIFNWHTYPAVRRFTRPGGALLLADFLRKATNTKVLSPELKDPEKASPDKIIHSFANLDRFPFSTSKKDKRNLHYRITEFKGYAGPARGKLSFLPVKGDDANAAILVIDDAGNGFRESRTAWPAALKKKKKPIVILNMTCPIARGALWREIYKNHAENVILIVDADNLRHEGVKISRCLSWERTAKDLVWQLASNPDLVSLNNCAYLIVQFGLDGALLYTRREGAVEARLFFDPKILEDGFAENCPGEMIGVDLAFVAVLAARIASKGIEGIEEGVRQGLLSGRRLWQLGFGQDPAKQDYPLSEIFKTSKADDAEIASVLIPNPRSTETADPDYWCILDDLAYSGLENIAYNYVIHGSDASLDQVPIGQFRFLKTFDRSEIESFRGIKNLIGEYFAKSHVSRPLCIAVFGAPGSGKSFGVTEVAESIAPGKIQKLEFNMSQFTSMDDLAAAFHKVRDVSLSGNIPIVFFDEFDSDFHGKLGWLKYFLSPMQDGQFRDGEAIHPIGRTIFVFAGGTCKTFTEFCSGESDVAFKNAKGPDFVSRLRGYVNIKGPNPLHEDEKLYMVRRAIFLRFLLEKNARNIFDRKKRCRMDAGVLRAFIKVPRYKHGVRSMQAIIEMSMIAGRRSFEQAALPSPEQLELHVDAHMFSQLVMRDVLLGSAREKLAMAIHERFLNENKGKRPKHDPSMAPWEGLREDLKESNRQQADHIPVKLKAINCDFAPVMGRKPILIRFTDKEIDIMSRMEHDRWMAERFMQGWSLGPRDVAKRTSPHLVKWEELSGNIKEYDRQAVRQIPQLLASAHFEIYRLKDR